MASSDACKSIFITGAGSGMGRATAMKFAREGWFVGAFDIAQDGLDTLKVEIGAEKGIFRTLDVTDAAAFQEAVEAFGFASGGNLDLMFSNAGITGTGGMFDEMAWDEIMQVVNVNFLGVMIGIRAAMPLLKETPNSLCLVNASSSAIWGTAGIGIYSATKHAVRGLVEALSIELKRHDIRAADLLPGLIDTPILSDGMRAMAPEEGMWRLVQPAEVADTVWQAYASDRLHWYVPEDLREFHRQVVDDPETVREERTELAKQMAAMADQTS
ncbi:short-chain dehydrogenase [Erythrobacter sp. QSSC1-22B]|uniref:SDR family oxidoreductase n=1 Tax=Erythrobacter sp. QSSC1-22B TaxID=1860125 RepID=UPI000805E5DE|nr:SDR family oxidoreductase [Erythrobacter sp. QSSC1-22B]OBX19784.1 short-chain dehydrogenase [Erythrobacter sp. QSSC1-22B]